MSSIDLGASMPQPATALAGGDARKFAPMFVFGILGITVLLAAPPIAAQFATQLGYSASQVGTYFFFELGAFSLATVPAYLWLGRVNARRVGLVALGIFAVGNLVSAMVLADFEVLLLVRTATGLAGGTLMVLALATANATANRDRSYALLIAAELAGAALALFALPRLFASVGLGAFYLILAAVSLVAITLVPGLAVDLGKNDAASAQAGRHPSQVLVILAILSVMLFYVAVGGVWTFASTAAAPTGLDPVAIGSVLAGASLFGIVGAVAASLLGGRVSRLATLSFGFAILVFSTASLALSPGILGFTAAIFGFKFSWTFVLPFVFGAATKSDPSGRVISTLNAVAGAGLALGPLVAGIALDHHVSLSTLFFVAAAGCVLSFVAILRVERLPA